MNMIHNTKIHQNTNAATININKQVVEKGVWISEHFSDFEKYPMAEKLYKRILSINGVESVSMKNYEAFVVKGQCFMWTAILPELLTAIYECLYHEEKNTTATLPAGYPVFSYEKKSSGDSRWSGTFIDDLTYTPDSRDFRHDDY
jgi:hypothetical protein